MSKHIKCPVCKGKGEIPQPTATSERGQKIKMAQTLVEAGYSYAEVATALGYKSRSSVTFAVKQQKKNGKT